MGVSMEGVRQYGEYQRVQVDICFQNSEPLPFTYNANGRILSHFEVDGERYVLAPVRDWDCEVCE